MNRRLQRKLKEGPGKGRGNRSAAAEDMERVFSNAEYKFEIENFTNELPEEPEDDMNRVFSNAEYKFEVENFTNELPESPRSSIKELSRTYSRGGSQRGGRHSGKITSEVETESRYKVNGKYVTKEEYEAAKARAARGGHSSANRYLVNGVAVTQAEYEAAKAKRAAQGSHFSEYSGRYATPSSTSITSTRPSSTSTSITSTRTYEVNGKQMTEAEFRAWQQSKLDADLHRVRSGHRRAVPSSRTSVSVERRIMVNGVQMTESELRAKHPDIARRLGL